MSINLNKVFDLSRNIFIEACAGAGKTWLLSKRYSNIMDDFARQQSESPQSTKRDASNILVITFTRKAAAEMSGRIYEDLNQLLNDKPLDNVPESFGSHLRQAPQSLKMHYRSTYSKNSISTIDSFCTQILREQAEQLDIDPEFRIQDEADTQRMELETWESFLKEKSRGGDENLQFLLNHLSLFHLSEFIKKFQSNAQLLNSWLSIQASHTVEELQEAFRQDHPLPTKMPRIEKLLGDLVLDLPDYAQMANADHAHYQRFKTLKDLLEDSHENDYDRGLALLESVRQIGLTSPRDKYLSRIVIPKGVWSDEWKSIISQRLKSFISEIQDELPIEMLVDGLPGEWDLIACGVQHHLALFFQGYWDVLNQRLKREGVLSFDEVILQARQLLMDPVIAAQYGQRFTHILFDEFQDTNDLRWDIVRLIAEGGQSVIRKRGLFIVGDTKQSIYRFNQADVQVMNRVRSLIKAGDGWVLTADETYRSSQRYVDSVINPLIGSAFPSAAEQDSIALYETVFRPTKAAISSEDTEESLNISRCSLSVVLENGNSGGASVDVLRTADLANDWLSWVETKGLEPKQGPTIGILLRSFTHILEYIKIFTARNLEFEVLSSQGLFAQQESYDLYHLMSVLINPLDDQALVGVLRSPLFVMTDDRIQKLKEQGRDGNQIGWVWNGLKNLHPEIVGILRDWQQASGREPLDRLITKIISEEERRLGWISETGGRLRLANLDRLLLMIHQLSLDGLGLREVHEYFKFQIQHGDASQAELPGAARIQILTIHKAKGLEFPVVLLPGLQSPLPSDKSGVFIGRLNEQWQAGINIDTHTASHKTWLFEQLKAQTKIEEAAEDKRLFYVAVTRASYGVGFIAKISPGRQPGSNSRWRRYLEPVFDLELDRDLAQNDPEALIAEWAERSSDDIFYDLTLGTDLLDKEAGNRPENAQPLFIPSPAMKSPVYNEISPHTIMTWMDQHHYSGSDERQVGEDLGLETSALTFGRLLHRAMEMEWFVPENHGDEIHLFLEDEGVIEPDQQALFLNDLTDCLSIYRRSELAGTLAKLPVSKKLPELPVFGYLRNESHVYKVSGIVDLLYQAKGKWVVLDYKTDRELPSFSNLKQHAYWFQIQTYLWILKYLYGIEARGELYFNRFDTIIPIEFEEAVYFTKIGQYEHGQYLEPFLPVSTPPELALQELIKGQDVNEQIMIIEPTKTSGERLAQSLATVGLNFPGLQILTLGEYRKLSEPAGRRLTPYLTRLAVAQLLGKRLQWGVVNRLAEAFYKATQGEVVIDTKQQLFGDFLKWCDHHKIRIPGQTGLAHERVVPQIIIINSIHSTSPADYSFLQNLATQQNLIFMDPLNEGPPVSGFNMSIEAWMRQEDMPENQNQHTYTSCFSIYEEVILNAAKIKALLAQGIEPEGIQIAVTSMERYVPAIKRVFDQVGISLRLNKREPVMERPVSQLAFALLQGRIRRHLSLETAMSVWLHPLVIPSGAEGYARLKLDIELRKMGVIQVDESLPERISHPKLKATAEELIKFIEETWLAGEASGLVDGADWLIKTLKEFKFTKRLDAGSVASKSYTSLKNAILGIRNDWERYLVRQGGLGDLNRELKERLRGVEVASSTQGFGIDVISLLDTLNLTGGQLFVMGLTEGQFPLTANTNPYLKTPHLNPWFLNLYLFKRWLAFPKGHLHLTAPLRNADGAALQESTFCQYLKREDFPELPELTLDQQYDQIAGKKLRVTDTVRQIRHNALLETPGTGTYYGELAKHDQRAFDHISASAFDELLKCPQRYWYSRKLRLEPAETNIADRQEIEVGNLVHKVLERFGNDEGFLLLRSSLAKAFEKLEKVALTVLAEQEIDLDVDLLNNKWGELYFRNFQNVELNLIAAMFKIEHEVLASYKDKGLHEQAFGDLKNEHSWPGYEIANEHLKLTLRGQIDRVLISGDNVWATDYKTGQVDLAASRELWTSQMLFYYLVLKARYPEKDVVLTYEQLKSFRDNKVGFKGFVGDVSSDNPVMDMLPPRSKAMLPVGEDLEWSIDRIKTETLAYAQVLAENNFPLTSRDETIACAYCLYDRICRKTALPR